MGVSFDKTLRFEDHSVGRGVCVVCAWKGWFCFGIFDFETTSCYVTKKALNSPVSSSKLYHVTPLQSRTPFIGEQH